MINDNSAVCGVLVSSCVVGTGLRAKGLCFAILSTSAGRLMKKYRQIERV